MPKQTVDVLMGGYLSKEAAREDFERVQACGSPLIGLVVVSKDLDGTLEIEQHDHIVKEGAVALGGVGFVVGLLAPPLLAATAVGAVIGAGVGKVAQGKVESALEAQAQETIPIGGAGLIVVYERQARGMPSRRPSREPIKKVDRRGDRQPREGRQGRPCRRLGEDGRRRIAVEHSARHGASVCAPPCRWQGDRLAYRSSGLRRSRDLAFACAGVLQPFIHVVAQGKRELWCR